jgi:hypothetical protein
MRDESKNKQADLIIKLIAREVLLKQKLSVLLWRQFLIGIAYGLGASIGAALVGAGLIYIYQKLIG